TPEMFAPLIQLIKASVAPGSWKNDDGFSPETGAYGMGAGMMAGGADDQNTPVGSITPFFLNQSLIIRHTAEVHDDVVDLLRQLRRLQDLQVSIEVRFITVSDSFFEQIGVDFDFSIQSDVVGKKSSFAIPNPAAPFAANNGQGGGGGGNGAGIVPYLVNPIRDHAIGPKPLVVGRSGSGGTGNFTPDLQIPFLQSTDQAIVPFNAVTTNTAAPCGIAVLRDLDGCRFLTPTHGDTGAD